MSVVFPHEIPLPPDLVNYVDGASPEPLDTGHPSPAHRIRLEYGSREAEDEPLETLDEQLKAAVSAYLDDLDKFLESSPDTGVPSYAYPDRHLPASRQQPDHSASGQVLDSWLEQASIYLPGAEDEAMAGVVAHISGNFNPEQFQLAIDLAEQDSGPRRPIEYTLHDIGGTLAYDTVRRLSTYATNPDTIRTFLDSPLFATFGTPLLLLRLQHRILQLSGAAPDETMLSRIRQLMANGTDLAGDLHWILPEFPHFATELSVDPAYHVTIRCMAQTVLRSLSPKDHQALVRTLEDPIASDPDAHPDEYAAMLGQTLLATGALTPDQTATLKRLIENDRVQNPWVYRALCLFLPVEEFTHLIAARPQLLEDAEIAEVYIRRLTRHGQLELACTTASRIPGYCGSMPAPVKCLLSIYDEVGCEAALLEAQERFAAAQEDNRLRITPAARFTFEALRFSAARKHGYIEPDAPAPAAMQEYFTHPSTDVCHKALQQMVRMYIDSGELDKAEQYAAQLYEADEPRTGRETLLHVLHAYMQTGNHNAAAQLVQTYFTPDNPDHHTQAAFAILHGEQPRWLIVDHLDATANLRSKLTYLV